MASNLKKIIQLNLKKQGLIDIVDAVIRTGSQRDTGYSDFDVDVLCQKELTINQYSKLQQAIRDSVSRAYPGGYSDDDVEIFPKITENYRDGLIKKALPDNLFKSADQVAFDTGSSQGEQWDCLDNSVLNLFLYMTADVLYKKIGTDFDLEKIFTNLIITPQGVASFVDMNYVKFFKYWKEFHTNNTNNSTESKKNFIDKICKSLIRTAFGFYLYHEVMSEHPDGRKAGTLEKIKSLRDNDTLPDTSFFEILKAYHQDKGVDSIFSDLAMDILKSAKEIREESREIEDFDQFIVGSTYQLLELTQRLPILSPLYPLIVQVGAVGFFESYGERKEPEYKTKILAKGETGDSLYLLTEGAVQIIDHAKKYKETRSASPFAMFGEYAALTNSDRTADVIAGNGVNGKGHIVFYELCINKVIEEFSDNFLDNASEDQSLDKVNAKKHYFLEALLSQLTKHLESSNAWRATSSKEKITQTNKTLFNRTSLATLPHRLENLLEKYSGKVIKRIHYDKGDTIIKSGTYADALYVLKNGSYFVSFNNNVRSDVISSAYRVFGETCLLEEKRNATIYSNERSDVYKITTDGINELKRKNAGIWRLIIYNSVVQRLEWIHDNRQNFID